MSEGICKMSNPLMHLPAEQIAAAAREIWEAEGRPEGKSEEHWLRAEALLRQQIMAAAAAATAVPIIPTRSEFPNPQPCPPNRRATGSTAREVFSIPIL